MTEMKRLLTAGAAIALVAGMLTAATTEASAQWRRGWGWGPGIAAGVIGGAIIGSALAAPWRAYPPPAGWAYYPAYAEPLPSPNCYWARMPVYDAYGNVVSWRGRARLICPPY
jgi:hypothetical protein